ncbi:MAG: type I secretion C-terminal target domain-containing protein, partial [Hyphomicrobiaceae bacterium]|nr:type I secretion C-terminal target domain-containing protein [Hyphomicrobiaceae bacterium]
QAGGSEADIQAALDKLTLTPPADSDIDITLGLAVTTVDRWGTAEASAPVTTTGLTHVVTVTADAAGDEPAISGSASGVEDQTFALPITVTLGDTDGSEILDKVEITGLPTGATLSWTGLPSGVTATAIAGGYVFDQTVASYATTQALQTFLANNLTIRAPQDSAADFDLTVTAFNYEQNLSGGGGRTAALPSTSATVSVTVTPAFDTYTLPTTSSLVNEDEDRAPSTSDGSAPNITNFPGSVVFGATINSAITRTGDTATVDATDRSEGITEIVLSGLPTGTVTWTDRTGVTVTEGPAGTFTIAVDTGNPPADPRALEAEIRLVLASFTYAASDHGSADIPVGVSISRQDIDPDTGTAITGVALAATHTIVVNAVADAPTVTGDTEVTREDVRVHLDDLTSALRDTDGSETLTIQITGVPTGASLTNTAGTAYASPSAGTYTIPVASLGDVYFVPPTQVSGVFAMTIIATATETTVAGEATADDVASVRAPIQVTVLPAVDPVVAEDSGSTVNENGTFNLGANIIESATDADATPEFSLADLDGSQSLTITITGFPAGISAFMDAGYTLPAGVTAVFNAGTGTFTLSGSHGGNVMAALAQVRATVTEDGDANFDLTVTAETAENNPDGLPEGAPGDLDPVTTVITHSVTVLAVADTPTVNRGSATKTAVMEDSGFVGYPVTTALNDLDGSETYQSVTVTYSTTGTGARPVLQFTAGGTTVDTTVNGTYTLGGATLVVTDGQARFTGTAADIDAALASLQARPGANNGQNISVSITAIAVESNPTEDNNGATAGMGGGVTGPEIATPTATRTQSFTIPVTPVPDGPALTNPANPTGTEDTIFALGSFAVPGGGDADGSEARFIEIETSSYPVGTAFTSGGSAIGSVVTAGWLRIPESAFNSVSIEPPTHFSGTINLVVRGVVTDTNTVSGAVTATTATQTLVVTVRPDADGIQQPGNSVGVEDRGPIGFGAVLANTTTGIRLVDNGTDVSAGEDNNADTETLSQVRLVVPADTASQTYTIGGTYAPGGDGTFPGSGSALVTYDAASRTYTITSSLITGDGSAVSLALRQQAETDIRATLATFTVTMGPTHTDLNGAIAVTATTLDVNGGVANSQDNAFSHALVVQAVADAPTVTATDPAGSTPEDGANVPLVVTVGQSADDDGSETLTVRITVPSDATGPIGTLTGSLPGITLTHQGGGVYLITATGADNAARAALFNAFMDGGSGDLAFNPRDNWSGQLTGTNGIKVEAISTEAATVYGDTSPAADDELAQNDHAASGTTGDLDTKVEIRTDYIDVNIAPEVDSPTVKGNGVGTEDTLIAVPMSVTLSDRDGSETYQVLLTGVVPATTRIFGVGGIEILPSYDAILDQNVYVLDADDVEALAILPPLHYSSALSGDILLSGVARVTDGAASQDIGFSPIPVHVTGVADTPGDRSLTITAEEDEPIELGASILATVGGDLDNLLVDNDGSETLSFVLSGMPAGVIPMTAAASGLTYIGLGTWSITAAAMETLTLPSLPNFSGENPYGGVRLRAVTQEIDGSQASSLEWDLTIDVNPVINAATVDGFSSWNLGATISEGATEAGTDISLANTASHAFVDNDGSETALSYTFDLSNLITDAGIADRLTALLGPGADLDDLVASYVHGTYTYNAAAGTITVLAANISGVSIDGTLFLDSNQDFAIPVNALVRDTATFPSSATVVTVDKVEAGSFGVDLVGTADTPTAYATAPADPVSGLPTFSGDAGTEIMLTLGGDSTDTDVALGRPLSEDIYYVVSLLNPGDAPLMTFTDGSGTVIGLDNGDHTWVLTPAELAVLHIITNAGDEGTAHLRLTTIATENDGDVALNSAVFDVVVGTDPGGGGGDPGDPGDPPLAPQLTIGTSTGLEDGTIVLNIDAEPGVGDTSNPSIAVMFSNIPAGAEVIGARYNVDTLRWVASAAAVNAGLVRIIPPEDFSGTLSISVEAVATNASLQQTTTGLTSAPIDVTPVADGVAITGSGGPGDEDTLIPLDITLAVNDTRGTWVGENAAEVIGGVPVTLAGGTTLAGSFAYVQLSDGATLPGYSLVVAGDSDATIDGQSLVGFYRVSTDMLDSLALRPADDWHGTVSVTVAAYTREPANGDISLSQSSFSVGVAAVADAPSVTAANASGAEDTAIALAGLTASLNDAVATNGAEVLSVKISGVPEGSIFSSGSNNGDGSWTIPLAALATLSLTPPLHYAGTMTLTLTAIALELANGDEAQTSVDFTVTVTPEADSVEILAKNVAVDATGETTLDLNVRMADTRGSEPGEHTAEQIRITFTGVPTGVWLEATGGGSVTNPSAGSFVFTGSEAEANAISAVVGAGAAAGTTTISLSAVTIDQGSTLALAVTDSFQLTVPTVVDGTALDDILTGAAGTQLIFGRDGIDDIDGAAGADLIVGGMGADLLTGGGGADTFRWDAGDLGTGVDTIHDFTIGAGGDALDVSALLSGFDPATSVIAEFIQLSVSGTDTVVRIDVDGGGNSFQDLVVLEGVTALDPGLLRTNGNLIV